jgi:hypothetical protein
MNGRWMNAAGGLLLASVVTGWQSHPAVAQTALTVDQIRACLCEEQTLAKLRQSNDAAKAVYDDRAKREQHLSQQIEQLRLSMDPNDLAAQDQLRELIDLRARAAQDVRDTALPAWQEATRRLNATVADYNANCANRPIYNIDDAEARKNLICPVTP